MRVKLFTVFRFCLFCLNNSSCSPSELGRLADILRNFLILNYVQLYMRHLITTQLLFCQMIMYSLFPKKSPLTSYFWSINIILPFGLMDTILLDLFSIKISSQKYGNKLIFIVSSRKLYNIGEKLALEEKWLFLICKTCHVPVTFNPCATLHLISTFSLCKFSSHAYFINKLSGALVLELKRKAYNIPTKCTEIRVVHWISP